VKIAQIAIPSPLHRVFDYYWAFPEPIQPGLRVTVPFGRRTLIGTVVGETSATTVDQNRMRKVQRLHDPQPLLSSELMALLDWSSRYYHHPIGEVLAAAIPVALRKGAAAELPVLRRYRLSSQAAVTVESLTRAPLQQRLLEHITHAGEAGLDATALAELGSSWRSALKQLIEKQCVDEFSIEMLPSNAAVDAPPDLLPEQTAAIQAVTKCEREFKCFLLNGVTGSGKTEVYLQLIQRQVQAGRQVLVLVPEISLTPQLLARFQRRISGCIVGLHSGLNDTERMHHWLLARNGQANVVIGTRSAIFTPLPHLGLIVIDEEHDGSLKQQDGFRYHARDLALMRALKISCPVVLGTATPSLETLNNARTGRYSELKLTQRAGDAQPPQIDLLDIRRRKLNEGLSDRLVDRIRQHLDDQGQALIFLNRRGFAPTVLCNDCGAAVDCKRCDAHMTYHARLNCLRCHHCGAERAVPPACDECQSTRLDLVGQGTERIEAALNTLFPDIHIARIDRDTTRRKGALQQQLDDATSGKARILVGTQMLAKGHHFPGVTLVGILDVDRGLYGTDYRSLEQMGQLIVQVAGRAGREQRRGHVMVQTRNPDNPLLQTLVRDGYNAFAEYALDERRAAELPPFSFMALVRAEATAQDRPPAYLRQVAQALAETTLPGLQSFGPVPAPMERIGGRYRYQLMVQAASRNELNRALAHVTRVFEESSEARKVRWSVDVDPIDFL